MTIACLGWGSLIWAPGNLPVEKEWFEDGPKIRIEFTRQSKDGRLTLVIVPNAPEVSSLWAIMTVGDIADARASLKEREGTPKHEYIGSWSEGDQAPTSIPSLPNWAAARNIKGVVWTALPAKFNSENRAPSPSEAIKYLSSLTGEARVRAEEYVRKAPAQINTPYRKLIVSELGWKY